MSRPLDTFFRDDGPQCPACGHVTEACEAHHYDEDWCAGECESCGEPYEVEVVKMIRWTTRPKVSAQDAADVG